MFEDYDTNPFGYVNKYNLICNKELYLQSYLSVFNSRINTFETTQCP